MEIADWPHVCPEAKKENDLPLEQYNDRREFYAQKHEPQRWRCILCGAEGGVQMRFMADVMSG